MSQKRGDAKVRNYRTTAWNQARIDTFLIRSVKILLNSGGSEGQWHSVYRGDQELIYSPSDLNRFEKARLPFASNSPSLGKCRER